MEPSIRPAGPDDAAAVAALLAQLGYPATVEAVADRIRRLSADARIAIRVAEHDGAVVGLATFHLLPVLHEDDPRGQLSALVVAQSARRAGIGRALVRDVEQLARARGVRGLVVTTANPRTATHRFYERLGYLWTGRRYARLLDADDAAAER